MALNYFLMLGVQLDLVINIDGFNELVLPPSENLLCRYRVTGQSTGGPIEGRTGPAFRSAMTLCRNPVVT